MSPEEQLAAEQAFHAAAVAFSEAFDAYEGTFERGLDPCDPYKVLERELLCTIRLSDSSIDSLKKRIDRERVEARRSQRRAPAPTNAKERR